MTDFLITMITLYPWFTWLLVIFAGAGLGYAAVWLARLQMAGYAWLGYRHQVWRAKARVRRRLLDDGLFDCPTCARLAEGMPGDDPPEYQHPDGGGDWDEPGEDWSPAAEYGQGTMAGVTEVLRRAHEAGLLDDDQLPDGPPGERTGPPLCDDPECDKYGWVHPPPCLTLPTMPVPQYTAPAMPAGPPVPWSGLAASLETLHRGDGDPVLHPKVAAELGHDTTEGALDSIFTRAQAAEVQAMITDGVTTANSGQRYYLEG